MPAQCPCGTSYDPRKPMSERCICKPNARCRDLHSSSSKLSLCFGHVPWKTAHFHILHASTNLFRRGRDLLESAGAIRDMKAVNRTDASGIGQLRASDSETLAQPIHHVRDLVGPLAGSAR